MVRCPICSDFESYPPSLKSIFDLIISNNIQNIFYTRLHHQCFYALMLLLLHVYRYLANDMQFFLTSPIIIFALWRHRTVGLGLLATLLVLLILILLAMSPLYSL